MSIKYRSIGSSDAFIAFIQEFRQVGETRAKFLFRGQASGWEPRPSLLRYVEPINGHRHLVEVERYLAHRFLQRAHFELPPNVSDMNPAEPWALWPHMQHTVMANEREVAQESRFVACTRPEGNHLELIKDLAQNATNQDTLDPVGCLKIETGAKASIRDLLGEMNINASTLCPGLDGAGRSLREELDQSYVDGRSVWSLKLRGNALLRR